MLKFLQVIFLLFFIQTALWAANGSIRGKVTDRATGKNIVGAQIWVLISNTSQIRAQAITDGEGNFVIENLANSTYDIECIAAGQISQKIIGLQITNNAIRLTYFKMNSNKGIVMSGGNVRAYRDSVELIYTYASLQARQNAETKSATASSQTLLDQPATGYLINSDDIAFRGYMSLLDVLRDVPEIELNENADPDYLNIISSRSSTGSGRWLIMQDGIRINTMMGSDIVISQNINIRHAAKIEIIIGAASAVYGADAFSGVINIISKNANLNGVELNSSFGSFNESNSTLVMGFQNKNLSVLATGSYFNTQAPNYPKLYPNDYALYNRYYATNGNVLISPDDSSNTTNLGTPQPFAMPSQAYNFNLLLKYKNVSFGGSRFYESHSSNSSYRPELSPPIAESQYSTVLNNAFVQHDLQRKKWSLNSIAQFNYWYIHPKTSYMDNISAYNRVYKYGYEQSAFARSIANYQIRKNQQLTFGLSLQYSKALAETADLSRKWDTNLSEEEQNFYYTNTDTVDYQGNFLGVPQENYFETRYSAGTFVQYQLKIKEKLTLFLGARFDYIYNTHGRFANDIHIYPVVNQRAGLVYKLNENSRFKLFYGSAFLTPSPNKVLNHYGNFVQEKDSLGRITGVRPDFFKLPTNEETIEEEAPISERLQSIEASFIYTKNNLLLSANGYFNYFTNVIRNEFVDSVPFFEGLPPVELAQIAFSDGQNISYGATVRAEYKWQINEQTNLRFDASYSFLDGKILDEFGGFEARLPFSAMHTGKLGIGFQYNKFSISLRGLYRSPTFQEPFEINEALAYQKSNKTFFVASVFANYQVASLDKDRFLVDVFVRARNLFNTRYYHTPYLDVISMAAVPQEPFGIFGGVQLRFNR